MPKKLSIPEHHREGVALLLHLNDDQVQALTRALDTTTLSAAEFANAVTIPGLERTNVSKIFIALLSLYVVRSAENIEIAEFVDTIIDAMQRSGDPKLAIESETATTRGRLLKLLSSREFSRLAKAEGLGTEFPNLVYGSRILTDLRPVFSESASETPLGFLIVHTLKMEYHEHKARHKEAYLTLSEAELTDLQEAITRALAKSQALQATLHVSGITYIQHAKRE